jgi:hypothetical protein
MAAPLRRHGAGAPERHRVPRPCVRFWSHGAGR